MSPQMFRCLPRQLASIALALAVLLGTAHATDTNRIVSIGGAVTEILYGLGADKDVVAVDTTSLYPPQAMKHKASVDYMRALSAEDVHGLRPHLIPAPEGSGAKETMTVLQPAKVPMVIVPDHHTGDGVIEKIQIIAKAVGPD